MSDVTAEYLNKFWELLDVILNAILFILIAFVILVIDFNLRYILLGIATIFIVLLTRLFLIYLPIYIMPGIVKVNKKEALIIWWGGLRGGLSLALVLSLPQSETKELLLVVTYTTVVFSILVQGLSISKQ